jgi:hypothetical protein
MNPARKSLVLGGALSAAAVLACAAAAPPDPAPGPAPAYRAAGACDLSVKIGGTLPLPCSLPLADYERVLSTWLNDREYARLDWARDRLVRDTGPFVLGANYGTHPAVRVYYSDEVAAWLEGGRKGALPVGSTIVKEMFNPPAARWEEQRPAGCDGESYREGGGEASSECRDFEAMLASSIGSWVAMIKDGTTHDGWFWAGASRADRRGRTAAEFEAAIAATVTTDGPPFAYRDSDHGSAVCLRCHATAAGESTFSSLENLEGDGLQFRVDESWRTGLAPEQRPAGGEGEALLFLNAFHGNSSAATTTPDGEDLVSDPLPAPDPEFTRWFRLGGGAPPPASEAEVQSFPGQWADHVPAGPDGAEQFLTSDNCLGCHGGLGGAPFGVNMFLQTGANYGDGYNISPFGEWRWSPMGLAGRDPAFFAQVASELALLDQDFAEHPDRFDGDPAVLAKAKDALVNTCLSCHGAMGQRQLLIDAVRDPHLDPSFQQEYVFAFTPLTEAERTPLNDRFHKYGNLARDGISCAVCHHVDPPEEVPGTGWSPLETFLMTSTTGQFPTSPPDELNGPFDDVQVLPMENALGITPKGNAYVQDSQMCGACHTINLPNVDATESHFPKLDESARLQAARLKERFGVDYAEFLAQFPHSIEQATFLEWQNSVFAAPGPNFQSCQDCHMPRDFHSVDGEVAIETLTSQIASIQDSTYPLADHSLPRAELEIPFRDDYRRHELVGLNVFLLEMFDQFDPVLGIAETDYMTSASTGNRLAIESMVRQGREATAELTVEMVSAAGGQVTADVTVQNLVGHRLPSGVAFRRVWIELLLLDESRGGEVVWASGRTNSVGLIVDGLGDQPLPTEFFEGNRFQPHYHGIPGPGDEPAEAPPITRSDQVQIYEEVTLDGEGDVTFSFIHRDLHVKDNRLLPRGWVASDQFEGEILQQFMESTDPVGVGGDPDYASVKSFAGRDRVRYIVPVPEGVEPSDLTVQATLYSQSFQPFWLQRRFQLAGDTPAGRRLYYLASHLQTQGTVIENWKLRLVGASRSVGGR